MCGGTIYSEIIPTTATCKCGKPMTDRCFNGLDWYIVCSGCDEGEVNCTCVVKPNLLKKLFGRK